MVTRRISRSVIFPALLAGLFAPEPMAAQATAPDAASAAGSVRAVETVDPASGAHRYELVEPLAPGEIAAVERRLAEEGHRPGEVDGRLDGATREALRAFQREEGLRVCGCVDGETVRALGLGLRVVLTRVQGDETSAGAEGGRPGVEVIYPTTVAPGVEAKRAEAESGGGELEGPESGDHGVEDVTRRAGQAGVGTFWGGTVLPIPVPVLVGPDGSPLPPDGSGGQTPAPSTGDRDGLRPAPFPRVPMPPIRPPRRSPG